MPANLTCGHCTGTFTTLALFDAHRISGSSRPARLRPKTCHCGQRHNPASRAELCSLCHYSPLLLVEFRKLRKEARLAVMDVRNGQITETVEATLSDYGLLIRDDNRDVGKAVDVFTGKPL
jgi:hypothetical protein